MTGHESQCLFCQGNSSLSVSVEHIAPESLGNSSLVLPPRVVCDTCNNYFARKVESPFLNSPAVKALRALEGLPNKRGRIPEVGVILHNGMTGSITKDPADATRILLMLDASSDAILDMVRNKKSPAIYFVDRDSIHSDRDAARFTAKVGIEYIAYVHLNFLATKAEIEPYTLMVPSELDACRLFARYGDNSRSWAVQVRRIYKSTHIFEDFPEQQRVWEMDWLLTEDSCIFAMSIFGLEFAINLYGPEMKAYDRWRASTGAPSLLFPQGIPDTLDER
ncbi:HNH endonuclease [Mycobacteroides abscessus]